MRGSHGPRTGALSILHSKVPGSDVGVHLPQLATRGVARLDGVPACPRASVVDAARCPVEQRPSQGHASARGHPRERPSTLQGLARGDDRFRQPVSAQGGDGDIEGPEAEHVPSNPLGIETRDVGLLDVAEAVLVVGRYAAQPAPTARVRGDSFLATHEDSAHGHIQIRLIASETGKSPRVAAIFTPCQGERNIWKTGRTRRSRSSTR